MPTDYIDLQLWQVAIAAALILVSGVISVLLKLGMERKLFLAAVRTVVQLLLIGFVLEWIFAPNQPWYYVLAMMSLMTLIAGVAAVQRTDRRYKGIWLDSILCMWASSWFVTAMAIFVIVQVPQRGHSWYYPQYSIPLLGMILGNTLNGISLGWDRLGGELVDKRDQVEALLALGATRWEAARKSIQTAVRTGMIPTINMMMVVGLVSLPGMMTGQLLAGMKPTSAVMYQIVIMFLIATGTALGTVFVVMLSFFRLFSPQHQFRLDRLKKPGE